MDSLRARQVDLENAEAELECQRQDFAWQQAKQPLDNDDAARTGAPSTLRLPHEAYSMAAATCRLEDVSNTPNLKTNKRLHEVKQLIHVALEQSAKSSASQHCVVFCRLSQPTTTTNRKRSNTHALPMGRSGGNSFGSSSGHLWTRGTKPR